MRSDDGDASRTPRRLAVRLTPRSSRNRIEIEGETARAWVTAAPTDGQANAALIRLVAETYGVAPSRVSIVRGHTSREKTVEIEGGSLTEWA